MNQRLVIALRKQRCPVYVGLGHPEPKRQSAGQDAAHGDNGYNETSKCCSGLTLSSGRGDRDWTE